MDVTSESCQNRKNNNAKSHFSPSSRPSPLPFKSPVKHGKPKQHSTSCCAPFNECLGMGSNSTTSRGYHHRQSASNTTENQQTDLRANRARWMQDLSPRVPSPMPRNLNISTAIDQANISSLYIEPHEIDFLERVGRGTTADIYRGTWKGLDVAVKCIYPNFFLSNPSGVAYFIQELETLAKQNHPFVLRLIGACLDPPEHGWMVTEFMSMTLKQWLHGDGRRQRERLVPLPALEERVAKALEIAEAMEYLHDQKPKLVHRDLKPSNIFLDDSKHIRIADFGNARFLQDDDEELTGETGTYVYMAPEVIRSERYKETCDVYSYGVILNELITGQHPYIETDFSPTEIALGVAEGNLRPKLPDEDDDQVRDLVDLICRSWDEDTAVRPSFASITCTLKNIQERFVISV